MDSFAASDSLIDGQIMYRKGDRVQINGQEYVAKCDITVGEAKRIDTSNNPAVIPQLLAPTKIV